MTATTAVAVLTLYAASFPGGFFLATLVLFLLWPAVAATWGIRVLARLIAALVSPREQVTFRQACRWLIPPAIVCLTVMLLVLRAPLHVRFALSKPSMEASAQQLLAAPPSQTASWGRRDRFGLYSCNPYIRDGGVYFCVPEGGFINPVGFVYLPSGRPAVLPPGIIRYVHLRGAWYVYEEDF